MRRKGRIVRYTADEIKDMVRRGEDRTDWNRVRATSRVEAERLADEEEGPPESGWEKTVIDGLPAPKKDVHIRLDSDVLDWFKRAGRGYQTRINKVLRAYVTSRGRVSR